MDYKKIFKENICKTSIGGQALIEGIMMKSSKGIGIVCRKPDGTLVNKMESIPNLEKSVIKNIPILRGSVLLISTMISGMKMLTYSADIAEQGYQEEELEKLKQENEEKYEEAVKKIEIEKEKTKGNSLGFFSIFMAIVISLGFAALLFVAMPAGLSVFLGKYINNNILLAIIEGSIKIFVFFLYIKVISLNKEINRVFMYHGAEHKTIHCYESGEALTVENARKQTTLHPRCGTSFLLIVLTISILFFSFVSFDSIIYRVGIKLLFMPIIVGISYELVKLVGKHNSNFSKIISYPGLLFQKLTTSEPTDDMLEVAIESLKMVIPSNINEEAW